MAATLRLSQRLHLVVLVALIAINTLLVQGFVNNHCNQQQQQQELGGGCSSSSRSSSSTELYIAGHYVGGERNNKKSDDEDPSFLWDDFKTHTGEILNPYSVLKVKRTATRTEIKKQYYHLSRRYHPDGVRHKSILPGSCNNLDDVREQWERINLAYVILKDDKLRNKFNRHEVISDPGAAFQRAAFDAVGSGVKAGVTGIGKGLFNVGAFAVNQMMNKDDKNKDDKSRD